MKMYGPQIWVGNPNWLLIALFEQILGIIWFSVGSPGTFGALVIFICTILLLLRGLQDQRASAIPRQ